MIYCTAAMHVWGLITARLGESALNLPAVKVRLRVSRIQPEVVAEAYSNLYYTPLNLSGWSASGVGEVTGRPNSKSSTRSPRLPLEIIPRYLAGSLGRCI